MAGLLKPPPGKPQGGSRMAAPAPAEMGDAEDLDEGMNVSPEEQAIYEEWINNGAELLYAREARDQMREALKGGEDPIEGLGNVVALISVRLTESAQEAGKEIPEGVALQAGSELTELGAELAEEMGLHEFTEEEIGAAYIKAVDLYRTMAQQQGLVDQEKAQADFAELQAADQEGRLDELAPGASEFAAKFGGGEAPMEGEEDEEDEEAMMPPPRRGTRRA